ncbi:hypothetical protein AB0J83_17450 [Actinoplanes sp. NPDC049596]|uniref:hypothetical protein n=1 Tax=unclassified Actinoplanes TaxID=2626549 RepID=UPI00342BA9FF
MLTLPEQRVYMSAGDRFWEITEGSVKPWAEPSALPGTAAPPRMALAFNKCAQFLT